MNHVRHVFVGSAEQIFASLVNSDYVAVLDARGKLIANNICRSSNKSPLKVYSSTAASIMLHSDEHGSGNGKGFRLRFRTIDYEPSGCGDPKKYVLASNDPTHISLVTQLLFEKNIYIYRVLLYLIKNGFLV